jgi:pyruvate kinase
MSRKFKRTKIVATVGPATSNPKVLKALVTAGANGLRLNMSHGTHDEHKAVIKLIRQISEELKKPLAVIVDLQGPKIRLGDMPAEGLNLTAGTQIKLAFEADYETDGVIPVQHDIAKYVKAGQPMFLRDGMVEVDIDKISGGDIYATVLNSGTVFAKQGINLPETDLGGDILTPKDHEDIKFACANDADYIALSFVQRAEDIELLRSKIKKLKSDAIVMAKIETKAGAKCLEDIVKASDAVMVARGDLAIETRPEHVPILQKQIIELAKKHQKSAIVATQMLESMIDSPQPTRAEVSDVATAVVQGADAVMLSAESAVGHYPVEAVALMKRVILYTLENRPDMLPRLRGDDVKRDAISAAAIILAEQLNAKLILAETSSGQTARNVSSFRPSTNLVAVTHNRRVYNQLAILWGARSYLVRNPKRASVEVMQMLRSVHDVSSGDAIVRAWGQKPGVTGGTDTIQIEVV